MRKLFWGLSAVSVAAVGGMVWLQWQGPSVPFPLTGTAMIECCRPAPGEASARGGLSSWMPGGTTQPAVSDDDLSHFQKPDDPIEISEPREPVVSEPRAAAIDFDPTPVVPTITIREPIEVANPETVAGSNTEGGIFATPPANPMFDPEVIPVTATVPAVMPYAEEDKEPVETIDPATEDIEPLPRMDDDDDSPSLWSRIFPAVNMHSCNHGGSSATPADCREDAHYHEQYPGCPVTGHAAPPPYVEPKKEAAPVVAPGGNEESDIPPVLQRKTNLKSLRDHLHKLTQDSEDGPAFPDVDTMEFRPSDHKPYEHLPNPI